MKRLVVVSNRVGPVRGAVQAGGLAVGLVDALQERHGLWFGWSGRTRLHREDIRLQSRQSGGMTVATVDLTQDDYDEYYNGYANRCLWPLFHFRIDLTHYEKRFLDGYRRVNAQFAQALYPLLKESDMIWVHDYHLFPLGSELRARGVTQRIGFFLHIPFPSVDMMSALPHHEWLIRSLFDYDLVGLQTEQDVERITEYITQVAGGYVRNGRARAYGRELMIRAFPIGIDADDYHGLAFSEHGTQESVRMREALNGRDQIICVDRLDYTKGLLRRMDAYEMLLEQHPEMHGRMELLQVAPVSRGDVKAYRDFRKELEQAAAHINGRFSRFDWTPVRYLNRALPRRTLAGLYRASRVALVTPVRDGMNLVAKEYVAAQDEKDPGVLVLSRFAGAAQQMTSALLVNPYDTGEMEKSLWQALTMGLDERRHRHTELMKGLRSYDARRWCGEFCTALARSADTRTAASQPAAVTQATG